MISLLCRTITACGLWQMKNPAERSTGFFVVGKILAELFNLLEGGKYEVMQFGSRLELAIIFAGVIAVIALVLYAEIFFHDVEESFLVKVQVE
ncbi:MAG: hypothetical protein IJP42_08740, partial [Selenomonadaceae bacterium]|nr:hypothetical protein [Selenomonadaceae bacterium]